MTISSDRHKPLFDVHPATGASIEVFYADRTLETFGGHGAGWFWHAHWRGSAGSGNGAISDELFGISGCLDELWRAVITICLIALLVRLLVVVAHKM